jgi:hypothetical protein
MKHKTEWGMSKKDRLVHRLGLGKCDVRQVVRRETLVRWKAEGRPESEMGRVVVR